MVTQKLCNFVGQLIRKTTPTVVCYLQPSWTPWFDVTDHNGLVPILGKSTPQTQSIADGVGSELDGHDFRMGKNVGGTGSRRYQRSYGRERGKTQK